MARSKPCKCLAFPVLQDAYAHPGKTKTVLPTHRSDN